jgi:hypothetical protein
VLTAFLDDDLDGAAGEEPRFLPPLVPRSFHPQPATPTPLVRRCLAIGFAPASPVLIYIGMAIGLACALSFSIAFALFRR